MYKKFSQVGKDWLNFMSFDERFRKSDGSFYYLHTALSSETKFYHDNKLYSVDGFVQTEKENFILEYNGCR